VNPSAHPAHENLADVRNATDADIVAATRRWIERAVVGLNLCPFARAPFASGRIRLRVSRATDASQLVEALRDELESLRATDPAVCETSLLIHPFVFADFLDFNDFLDVADELLREMDLEGEIQIASFHPDYQFADTAADAVGNNTNRSPWPTLHLLRESSVEQAVTSGVDTDAIPERNIETLQRLGDSGWRALWNEGDPA
jgi:hypothetical protein